MGHVNGTIRAKDAIGYRGDNRFARNCGYGYRYEGNDGPCTGEVVSEHLLSHEAFRVSF